MSTHRHRVTAGGARPAVCVLAPQGSVMRLRGCRHLVLALLLAARPSKGSCRFLPDAWVLGPVGPRGSGRGARAVMRDLRVQASGIVCVVVLESLVCRFSGF
jgi:hypothetical protein